MEGGYKPWRIQCLDNSIVDLDTLSSKPLPPPPSGHFWEKNIIDGSWELVQCKNTESDIRVIESEIKFIDHVVMQDDTLPGICLRYNVSVVDVRRCNNFSGNAFRSKKVLRIPIRAGSFINPQEQTQEVILQKFKNLSGVQNAEARYYLDENAWELDMAMKAWETDENWSVQRNGVIDKNFSKKMEKSTIPSKKAAEEISSVDVNLSSIDKTFHPRIVNDCNIDADMKALASNNMLRNIGVSIHKIVAPSEVIDFSEQPLLEPLLS